METRILIVEDHFIASDTIKDQLYELGYRDVEAAFTGAEAVAKAAVFQPDVVLMDINLGAGIDGIEAAVQIRAARDVPIIYLTAYDDEATLRRAKVTEPYAYITKPFTERDLAIAIEIALYKREIELALQKTQEQYRLLAENASDGVALLEHGKLTYRSPSYMKILGITREELERSQIEDMFARIHDEDRERIMKAVRDAHVRQLGEYRYEYRLRSGNKYIWVEDTIRSEYDAAGNRVRSIIHSRDISARKEAEIERERLIAELQQALNQIKTLKDLLPICASCKKIRDDEGYWHQVDVYIRNNSHVEFTHGICPDCMQKLYPDLFK